MVGSFLNIPSPPGERVRVRGNRFVDLFGYAEPPHPDLLPRGEKETGSCSPHLTSPHATATPLFSAAKAWAKVKSALVLAWMR
ncbi:hypothetical protein FZ942_11280 [Azospirillum lipoferum]|uniref:Uncharacterized protein n=1 Tax=Azospirillum lipoferum TaxID=193 RepID=A0A5A9GQM1_AZOLI|nr:hypothetical protein FZ942_11280 [Azospirillum lipoferum]